MAHARQCTWRAAWKDRAQPRIAEVRADVDIYPDQLRAVGHVDHVRAVRDLRIANPAWASRPDFLSVSNGEARVDLEALLKGRVTVRSVRLNGIDLLLERGAQKSMLSAQGLSAYDYALLADKPENAELLK